MEQPPDTERENYTPATPNAELSELPDGVSRVVSSGQQEQVPPYAGHQESEKAVGRTSADRAAIGVDVGRLLSQRDLEVTRIAKRMTPLDSIIYRGRITQQRRRSARLNRESLVIRGLASIPKGDRPLDRLDIRLPLARYPELAEEYAAKDREYRELIDSYNIPINSENS